MTAQLLLATRETDLEREVRDVLAEGDQFTVSTVVTTAPELEQRIADGGPDDGPDAVLVHDALGPGPAMVMVGEIVHRYPSAAVVVLTRDTGPEMLAASMRAGARAVLSLPLSYAQVQDRLEAVVAWGRRIRSWQHGQEDEGTRRRGRIVAVAGCRGGVGTTTVALQVALAAQRRGTRTCLVDLDLQSGDVGALLGIPSTHSAVDLVDVAHELTWPTAQESMYRHESGLHVLPGPAEGERAELVTSATARRLLAVLRGGWDLVVVDCGSTVTEAGLGVVESAHRTVVVTQPDVASLQATHRLVDLWSRLLGRRPDDMLAVLNRRSRHRAVQPALVRRALQVPVSRTSLPSRFGALEHALNTLSLDEVDDRRYLRAVRSLTAEVAPLDPVPGRSRGRAAALVRRRQAVVGDAGAQHAEMAALLPVLVLLVGLVVQAVLYGTGLLLAQDRAADVAADLAAGGDASGAAGAVRADLPPGWELTDVDVTDGSVVVRVRPPVLLPGLDPDLALTGRSVR